MHDYEVSIPIAGVRERRIWFFGCFPMQLIRASADESRCCVEAKQMSHKALAQIEETLGGVFNYYAQALSCRLISLHVKIKTL